MMLCMIIGFELSEGSSELDYTSSLKLHCNLVQLADDEGSVVEGPNLFVALPVDNGHGLQAHGLHGRLGREQESVVKVVEKLQPIIPHRLNEWTR